ncbi:6-phosphofructokinase [Candidatus Woesearchaeota archaeon]|nr:6-phosphofructokinase [Candidatus Woesearchaeota archaeon]
MAKGKIAVFTGGGDCPGLNNAIKWVVRSAEGKYNVEGITEGWLGACEIALHPEKIKTYTPKLNVLAVRRIEREGGTILMSSRANPFKYTSEDKAVVKQDISDVVLKSLNERYHAVVAIGGEDTLGAAGKLAQKGLRVVGIPKTIDKDLCGTQFTIGYDSALNAASFELNKLRSSAGSHGMVYFVEIMGRRAGHLTYHAGLASNVHFMTIPEVETDLERLFQVILDRKFKEKYPGYHRDGRRYTIVAVAEGTQIKGVGEIIKSGQLDPHGNPKLGDVSVFMAEQYIKRTGDANVRDMALKYIPRSGEPSVDDKINGRRVGEKALRLIEKDEFSRMVSLLDGRTADVPLIDVVDRIRILDAQICFDKDNYVPILTDNYYPEREVDK